MKLNEVHPGQYVVLNDSPNAALWVVTKVGIQGYDFLCEIIEADAARSRPQHVDVSLLQEPTDEQMGLPGQFDPSLAHK